MSIYHGSFVLLKKLGEGQFASVFEGYHKGSPKVPLAIKILDRVKLLAQYSQYETYITREINAMILLQKSDNVIALHSIEKYADRIYIAMEFCAGDTLKTYLNPGNKSITLSEEKTQDFMRQIANGMKHLYGKAVVHRDLKPQNILLSSMDKPILKIADFGFARVMQKGDVMQASQLGTPIYMAPEIMASNYYSDACDLWSVGLIMYEMLYGFDLLYSNIKTIRMGLQRKDLPKNKHVSPECADLLISLLQLVNKRIQWLDFFNHPFLREPHEELVASIIRTVPENTVPIFVIPDLLVRSIKAGNVAKIADWKRENGLSDYTIILCKNMHNNQADSPENWEGLELKDHTSIDLQNQTQQYLFAFSDSKEITEGLIDVRVDPPQVYDEKAVRSIANMKQFLAECARIGREIFEDSLKVYDKCAQYILKRELLQCSLRALSIAVETSRSAQEQKYNIIESNLVSHQKQQEEINDKFNIAAQALTQLGFSHEFLTVNKKEIENVITKYQQINNNFAKLRSDLTKAIANAKLQINDLEGKDMSSLPNLRDIKAKFNGEIFEWKRNMEIFKNTLVDLNEKYTASPMDEIAEDGDPSPEQQKRQRCAALLYYSQFINQRLRAFLTQCQQVKDDVVVEKIQRFLRFNKKLSALAGEVVSDLIPESVSNITRSMTLYLETKTTLQEFIHLPEIIHSLLALLHDRQAYEQQVNTVFPKINSHFADLYTHHENTLTDFFTQHKRLLSEVFPLFHTLPPLARVVPTLPTPPTLHLLSQFPLPSTPNKAARLDLEEEFSIIVSDNTDVKLLVRQNAKLAEDLHNAKLRNEDTEVKREYLHLAKLYDDLQGRTAKPIEYINIKIDYRVEMEKTITELRDQLKNKDAQIASSAKFEERNKELEVQLAKLSTASPTEQQLKTELEELREINKQLTQRNAYLEDRDFAYQLSFHDASQLPPAK